MDEDKNDNEMKGQLRDIDLLITSAESVVSGNERGLNLDSRIKNLDVVAKRVHAQYEEAKAT